MATAKLKLAIAASTVCFFASFANFRTQAKTPANSDPSTASIGIVLGGGGAFGAWQVGALQAFFDHWKKTHGSEPPVRIVVGTSTGALIAPMAFRGRNALEEAHRWYVSVKQSDLIAPRPSLLLPFPIFMLSENSFFTAGYPRKKLLHRAVMQALDERAMQEISSAWPERKIGVTTTDFRSGQPRLWTNDPAERGKDFRDGVFASAMAPLALPPVRTRDGELLFDGGVYANVPVRALFNLAEKNPRTRLTHIIVDTPLAEFPGNETHPVQSRAFPENPTFRDVNERAVQLYSESSASKDIALLCAALALQNAGVNSKQIEQATGIALGQNSPKLIVLQPRGRLGWRSLEFRKNDMQEMYRRGYDDTLEQLSR